MVGVMRVALCLSGQPRSFDGCFPRLKEFVLDPLKCDVFFHFWESHSDELGNTWKEKVNRDWPPLVGDRLEYIKSQLKPKDFLVDTQRLFQIDRFEPRQGTGGIQYSVPNMLSMYYSIWQCNLLCRRYASDNNIVYDRVIRARTDLMFREPIPEPALHDPDLVIPSRYDDVVHSVKDEVDNGILNDQCAIGDMETMNKYSATYLMLEQLFKRGFNMHPETMLNAALKDLKVSISHIVWPFALTRSPS